MAAESIGRAGGIRVLAVHALRKRNVGRQEHEALRRWSTTALTYSERVFSVTQRGSRDHAVDRTAAEARGMERAPNVSTAVVADLFS